MTGQEAWVLWPTHRSSLLLGLSFPNCTVGNTHLAQPCTGATCTEWPESTRTVNLPQIPPCLAKALPLPDLCDGVWLVQEKEFLIIRGKAAAVAQMH